MVELYLYKYVSSLSHTSTCKYIVLFSYSFINSVVVLGTYPLYAKYN